MLTINTNLSSIITQSSLTKATIGLNQAIERMSTGFKINHAKDNAANYSISTNLSTKISAYQVAEDNASMGLDMVTTASETLKSMENSLSRARALCIQAQNGTYGSKSLEAINLELNTILDEFVRNKNIAKYNGISVLNSEEEPTNAMPQADLLTGFIAEIKYENPDVIVSDSTKLLESIQNNSVIGISNEETLAELANLVNSETENCDGKTIVLTNDIDLSAYDNWTPIGWYDSANTNFHVFKGEFNGNGHTISNLKITTTMHDGVGLFGFSKGKISNVSLKNVDINSQNEDTGGVVGYFSNNIENCCATGNVISSKAFVGGICGNAIYSTISSSYSTTNVKGYQYVGCLTGQVQNITNCYAEGIAEAASNVGCLAGMSYIIIKNSYSNGITKGTNHSIGGLVGNAMGKISNCYSTGKVEGRSSVGGLAGGSYDRTLLIQDSYSNCSVIGTNTVGGLYGAPQNGGTATAVNSYWDIEASGQTASYVGTGVTTEELNKLIEQGILPSLGTKYENANLEFLIGINSKVSSVVDVNLHFSSNELDAIRNRADSSYSITLIDKLISKISAKQVELGATQNRLVSALDEISTQYQNLVSTRSTIRDADIAEESSEYIKHQILQQASATLLASANQTPAIALQLI